MEVHVKNIILKILIIPQVSGVQATNSSNKIQNLMTILKLNRIFVPDFNK